MRSTALLQPQLRGRVDGIMVNVDDLTMKRPGNLSDGIFNLKTNSNLRTHRSKFFRDRGFGTDSTSKYPKLVRIGGSYSRYAGNIAPRPKV